MSYIEALIFGLVQGATEFLPVSSSGHLSLLSKITGVAPSLFFDLVLHLGTLCAVVIVYFGDVAELIKHPLGKRTRLILLSTAVSAVIVFLLKDTVERTLNGTALPFFFMLTAIILFTSVHFSPRKSQKEMNALDAIIIGAAQGFAAFPGLSRSGLTSSAGRFLGYRGEQNASYCFILSIPIILGSAIVEFIGGEFIPVPFGCLAVGFIAAFVSGFIALKAIKKVFAANRFDIFSAYLVLLSVFLILNDCVLHLF